MNTDSQAIYSKNNLNNKQRSTLMHENVSDKRIAELDKNREKWLKAVDYFTCVDDVNF